MDWFGGILFEAAFWNRLLEFDGCLDVSHFYVIIVLSVPKCIKVGGETKQCKVKITIRTTPNARTYPEDTYIRVPASPRSDCNQLFDSDVAPSAPSFRLNFRQS